MVEVKYNNTVAYTVSYNGDGAISKVVDNRSGITTEYEYDSLGRLIFAIEYETSSKTVVLQTENKYDSFGRSLGSSYDLPDIDIGYSVDYKDNSNLIEGFLQHNSSDMELNGKFYTYDALERLTGVRVVMDGLTVYTESYTYVSNGNNTSSLVATHTVDGATYSYTYDDIGNITSVSENGTLRANYYYDSLGQLTMVNYYPDCYYSEYYIDAYEYQYDKSGNITVKRHHYGIDAAYSDSVTYTYANDAWGDLLTAYNGTAITYDTIGNPSKWRNATNIEWYGRQLSLFNHSDGTITCYGYNADGIRTSKYFYDASGYATGTVKYTLDGSTIVAENRNGTNIYYTYDDKGAIMGMIYGGETYMFSKNLQGDVIGIYNSGRQLVAKYQYNAFGEITAITDASGNDVSGNANHIANVNPFRYRGYYYDTETGFYYLQSRYYDPVVGRFINADAFVSTGQGILGNNMFAYCNNEPVNRIDPYGLCSTASDIRDCLQGGCGCSHNHCTAEYIIMKHFVEPNTQWIEIPYYIREHNRTMLSSVESNLRHDAIMFLAKSYDAGHTLFVTWGSRDVDPDLPKGPHIYGWAFDFQFWDDKYMSYITSGNFDAHDFHYNVIDTYRGNDPRWDIVGPIGESCGLVWGRTLYNKGVFKNDDPCHFQIPGFWILRERIHGVPNAPGYII